MSERRARRIGAAAVLVSAVCLVLTAVCVGLNPGHDTPTGAGNSGAVSGMTLALTGLAFAAVGGLLVSRVPGNAIGWIFCLCGLGLSLSMLGGQYANYAVFVASPPLAGGRLAVLLDDVA